MIWIMASGTRPLAQEQRFVMEKIAQVVVGIARCDWPDRWPSLFHDLRALALGSQSQAGDRDVQRYLTLLVWKGLADDTAAADISSAARTRMLKGLQGEQVGCPRRNKSVPRLAASCHCNCLNRMRLFDC